MAGDSSRIVRVSLHKIIITTCNCHQFRPAMRHNPYAFAQILSTQSTSLASLTINFDHGSSIRDAYWMSGTQVPLFPNLRMIRLYIGPGVSNYGVEMTDDFAEFARALIVASGALLSFTLNGQLLRVDLARLFEDLDHPQLHKLTLIHGAGSQGRRHIVSALPVILRPPPLFALWTLKSSSSWANEFTLQRTHARALCNIRAPSWDVAPPDLASHSLTSISNFAHLFSCQLVVTCHVCHGHGGRRNALR